MQRTALVTGASRGIGLAVARGLASDGHRVVFAARSVEAVSDIATACGGVAVALDVTDQASLDAALAQVGPIDILVNNAGVSDSARFVDTTDEMWDRMIAVNLTGCFRVARACVGSMIERGWGRVVLIASPAGLTGLRYTAPYCASKHGVVGLARAMADELAATGVTVNSVCPGFVETDMARDAIDRIERTSRLDADGARRALEKFSPQGRLMQPDEVYFLVRTLVAEDAHGINGQAIVIDGGQVLH